MAANSAQSTLRRAFKAAQRRKDRADYICALKADEIAQLSAPQVLKIMHFLDETSSRPAAGDIALGLLEQNLQQGILYNPDLRQWYAAQLKDVQAVALENNTFIWKGSMDQIDGRRATVAEALGREETFADFFMVLSHLQTALADRFMQNRIMHLGRWRQERFIRALFPREESLRPAVKLFGEDTQALEPFKAQVQRVANSIPGFLRHFLHQAGYMFCLAQRLGHIDTNYANQDPAYARGATYEHTASGSMVPNRLAIDLPEVSLTRTDPYNPEPYQTHTTDEDLAETIAHEAWHGIEMALSSFAESPMVRKAYEQDLCNLQREDDINKYIPVLHYFLPRTLGGRHTLLAVAREEAFVEIGAEVSLSGGKKKPLSKLMPELAGAAEALIGALRADFALMPTGLEFPWGPGLDRLLQDRSAPAPSNSLK